MVTVFEKKGRGALGLLFLRSMPEVMAEGLVKKDNLKAKWWPAVLWFMFTMDDILVTF